MLCMHCKYMRKAYFSAIVFCEKFTIMPKCNILCVKNIF